jgi:hypothetical protein
MIAFPKQYTSEFCAGTVACRESDATRHQPNWEESMTALKRLICFAAALASGFSVAKAADLRIRAVWP